MWFLDMHIPTGLISIFVMGDMVVTRLVSDARIAQQEHNEVLNVLNLLCLGAVVLDIVLLYLKK